MTASSYNMSNDNRTGSPTSSPRSSPRPSPRPQSKREHAKSDTYLTVNFGNGKEGAGKQQQQQQQQQQHQQQPPPPPQQQEPQTPTMGFKGVDHPGGNHSSGTSTPKGVELIAPHPIIDYNRSESIGGSSVKDKIRTKKKSAWYNVLYPTYKSRSEDYRQIFKGVPDDERLVVDYSCALQKEILVQGRLYVSQNYLCFYANIFGWETNVSCKWKDVTAITKEKTALVIPNAILIATQNDRFFFTSFVARDKTYLMLFRVWQNALMDRPMNQQEMWQLVHDSYGAELGLTSDDEDYIAPGTEDDKFSERISAESFTEECGSINLDSLQLEHQIMDEKPDEDSQSVSPSESRGTGNQDTHIPGRARDSDRGGGADINGIGGDQLPTDLSDTTESDREKEKTPDSLPPMHRSSHQFDPNNLNSRDQPDPSCSSSEEKLYPVCSALHEGRLLMNEVIPLHVDQVFTLLFTSSKFFLDFHASRKTTDLTQRTWTHNSVDNTKSRVLTLTVSLNQTVGPKTAQVTETQVMLPCSRAGYLYSIDIETVNAGVPYADSFYVPVHYCIHRISDTQSSIAVYAQIKYKKHVWGLVKGMIEKNCWQGLDDFFTCLAKALLVEAEETTCTTVKRKSRLRRRQKSVQRPSSEEIGPVRGPLTRIKGTSTRRLSQSNFATSIVFAVLILLFILNVLLYYKLWSLEEAPPYNVIDLQVLKDPPKSHDDWIKLLQKQEALHTVEMQKWQKILKTAIRLLKQAEESLGELQRSIHPTYTNKIMSIIENHQNGISEGTEQQNNEEL